MPNSTTKQRKNLYNQTKSLAGKIYNMEHLPRWAVLLIDVFIISCSLLITYTFMHLWNVVDGFSPLNDIYSIFIVFIISVIYLLSFNISSGVIRHSSLHDIIKISLACTLNLFTLLAISYGYYYLNEVKLFYDPSIIFHSIISFLGLILFRFYVKLVFINFTKWFNSENNENILVFGTDEGAVAIANTIKDRNQVFNLKGFINPKNISSKNRILSKKIYTINDVLNNQEIIDSIKSVIFDDEFLKNDEFESLANKLIQKNYKIYHIPLKVFDKNDNSSANEIQSLKIEDLLYREQITIENDEISKRHIDKNILVTGGAGSIGSEIVRKVAQFSPKIIVVVDQAETPLNSLKLELTESFPNQKFVFHLADVSNKYRIEPLFKKYNFSMVYHAAAYKHVPIIEENPTEAINVNIIGSKILADLSNKYKINRFVMVSTDKAVNPTNVMGASKRVAELYVQSLQEKPENTTKFITTRFGNVLGSNGSVIPLFRAQIEKGGPVTVTHEEITRYFMTIPEACELVLQAGTMGHGGEIFVFDMGEPVKIIDLAKKMIKLSGLEPYRDIPIHITGLRSGEKLYEELLSDKSTTLPTYHDKIMCSKDERIPYEVISDKIQKLARASIKRDKVELVLMIKNIVPEFISQNSEFENLD
ncbi:UDP-glucose 4-epimerase [Candidatus Ornithobacterium hominis]|uniref:UDP-glucose 4-epimerase n=2 Tax=Candidatus Ornithobacterium hominis TaxID=2497989 RepID=A0A383TWP3_9FLAO|nr:nucleoside-diphosphate sugar epimerase/dehydratase [Candidatus Ornithobacterium hominis]MCT7904509.1 polysaccharide biosynthesis protein [Candidatus Ornithobacterium hominis]SZD71406.1 UDP-glucose 4-epimerase [Candidatus Ornithobacterium hominis]SZD72087.1 UDP-glucose 4-epimerase [Candidatus Ornithobacterium hominis]